MSNKNPNKVQGRIRWYIEHRIEYLQNKQEALKQSLLSEESFDYNSLKLYMENRGKLKELTRILEHLEIWQD